MFIRKSFSKMLLIVTLAAAAAMPLSHLQVAAADTDANVEFERGELEFGDMDGTSIKTLGFGKHKVPTVTTPFTAETINVTGEKPGGDNAGSLTVNDGRGTGTGWHVTVQLKDFYYTKPEQPETPIKTLTGSYMTFENSSVTYNGKAHTQSDTTIYTPSVIRVEAGQSDTLALNATEGYGMGTTSASWTKANIKLHVAPGDVYGDTSPSAILVWTINDAPF